MHGFNQGSTLLHAMCEVEDSPDIFMIQENWLTSANLFKLSNFNSKYTFYGVSAMESALSHGILRGRPWGGVSLLIKTALCKNISLVSCKEK